MAWSFIGHSSLISPDPRPTSGDFAEVKWISFHNYQYHRIECGDVVEDNFHYFYVIIFMCQWLASSLCFSPGTPLFSTNKTDQHVITEILLKVVLNIITQCIYVLNFWTIEFSNLHNNEYLPRLEVGIPLERFPSYYIS